MKTAELARNLRDADFLNKLSEVKSGKDFGVFKDQTYKVFTKQNSMFINYRKTVTAEEFKALELPLVGTQQEKGKKVAPAPKPVVNAEPAIYMQSKTGMYHLLGGTFNDKKHSKCQSYNYDRLNELTGEQLSELPEGARFCKKCATHLKGGN